MPDLWALALALLGLWGGYTTGRLLGAPRPWNGQRWYSLAVDALFTASCTLGAAALHGRWFAGWTAIPLGFAYAAMIPVPCYFEPVNRIRWLHALRNAAFTAVAAACFGVAAGWLPLRRLGL